MVRGEGVEERELAVQVDGDGLDMVVRSMWKCVLEEELWCWGTGRGDDLLRHFTV